MSRNPYAHLPMVIAATLAPGLLTAKDVGLTIYRNDAGALFEGGGSPVSDGYAIIHERRDVKLDGGRQQIAIDGLPTTLDPEAVALDLGSTKVLAQRVLSVGDGGTLAAHRGERVELINANGSVLAGVLVGVDGAGLSLREDSGTVRYVREYASVRFLEQTGQPGSLLQVLVDGSAGDVAATLTYPASGLGWRAAYSATVAPGNACRLRLDALASIANRSGRDYSGAAIKLVAGEPNFAKPGGPRVHMAMMKSAEAFDSAPEQSSLGDYRVYVLAGPVDLPDASVTQTALYPARDLDCQRTWLFESGQRWMPDKPMLTQGDPERSAGPIVSQLRFAAMENMPAGYLRVLSRDRDNRVEFIGEGRVPDTGKGREVSMNIGNAFDLSGQRERTGFSVDRATHQMDEAFRIVLTNSGSTARDVTVLEHPNRWRNWKLASSTIKPTRQSADSLEFVVSVPANGKATLDYAIDYSWTLRDE